MSPSSTCQPLSPTCTFSQPEADSLTSSARSSPSPSHPWGLDASLDLTYRFTPRCYQRRMGRWRTNLGTDLDAACTASLPSCGFVSHGLKLV